MANLTNKLIGQTNGDKMNYMENINYNGEIYGEKMLAPKLQLEQDNLDYL